MIDKFKYTEKEHKKLIKSLGILIDTREKSNKHITDWFDKRKIPYRKQALKQGDYSFFIPADKELHIDRDLYFNNAVCIERKGSLEELSTNLTSKRVQFKHELSHYPGQMSMMIEDSTYKNICTGDYNTKLDPIRYLANLHSLSSEFQTPFIFVDKDYAGQYIYFYLYYWFRNYLK